MIQRTLTFAILFSMVLHCAGRLGVLSYLYQNRHEIANTVGLISEIPIALCSNDYNDNKSLVINQSEPDKSMPVSFLSTQEIILFFQAHAFAFTLNKIALEGNAKSEYTLPRYRSPYLTIFQPPRLS